MIRHVLVLTILIALVVGPVSGCKLCYQCTNDEIARDNAALNVEEDLERAETPSDVEEEKDDSDA